MNGKIVPMDTQELPQRGCIFKHSTRCPVSANAAAEVEAFDWKVPVYWINVIEERPMSNWVAEAAKVAHQSPQLIYFVDGKPVKVLSHGDIHSGNFSQMN